MNNNNRNHFQQITSNTALPHQNQQVLHQQAHSNALSSSNNLNVDHRNKSYGQTMTVQIPTQQASLNNNNLSGHVNRQVVKPTSHEIFQGQPNLQVGAVKPTSHQIFQGQPNGQFGAVKTTNHQIFQGQPNGQVGAVKPTNHQIFQGQPKQNLHDTNVYQQQNYQLNVNWKKLNGILTRQNREKARRKYLQQASLNTTNVTNNAHWQSGVVEPTNQQRQLNHTNCFYDKQANQQFGLATQQYCPSYNHRYVSYTENNSANYNHSIGHGYNSRDSHAKNNTATQIPGKSVKSLCLKNESLPLGLTDDDVLILSTKQLNHRLRNAR